VLQGELKDRRKSRCWARDFLGFIVAGLDRTARLRLFGNLRHFLTSGETFLRTVAIRVELLGPPRRYWGEDRCPVLVRPAETIDALRWR